MIRVTLDAGTLAWRPESYAEPTAEGVSALPREARFVPTPSGRAALRPADRNRGETPAEPQEWDVDAPFRDD